MDDRDAYGSPDMALQMVDSKDYHQVPEGVPCYEHWPWS